MQGYTYKNTFINIYIVISIDKEMVQYTNVLKPKMHASTLKCSGRHKDALPSMHQLPLPLYFGIQETVENIYVKYRYIGIEIYFMSLWNVIILVYLWWS